SFMGTFSIIVMIFMIMMGANTFSQILSFTGVTTNLVQFVGDFNLHPIVLLFFISLTLFILGCFLEPVSMMMMMIPILLPISQAMDFNLLWFGVILLINMQVATITPPFGMDLFAMKAVVQDKI